MQKAWTHEKWDIQYNIYTIQVHYVREHYMKKIDALNRNANTIVLSGEPCNKIQMAVLSV